MDKKRTSERKSEQKKTLGRLGEEMAAVMLEEKGYEILTRNYRCRGGEIDIIALKNHIIVFVEVKTRSFSGFGEPAEAVTWSKQQKIRHTALHFLNEYTECFHGVEFQVVEVVLRHHDELDF